MRYEAPEEMPAGGGNWIDKPGTYHFVITAVDEEPVSKKSKMLDGFRVDFVALEGTVKDKDGNFTERKKTWDKVFFHPKLTDKNEGLFSRQKQAAFFIAAGLMTEKQLGKEIDIDLNAAIGRQVIATLEPSEQDGKTYMDLSYTNIFHIDDPRAAGFPRDAKSISLCPPELRRDPKSFVIPKSTTNGSGGAKSKPKDIDLDNF